MNNIISQMLDEYALKEIIQELALLGLWRTKFYEHALFYGGPSLRILYGLPRFSEDLDFSLLKKDLSFDLSKYYLGIKEELESFGLSTEISEKEKSNTQINFLRISVPEEILKRIQKNQSLKIKIEVDLDPPGHHGIEVKEIFRPIPFQVKTMPLSDLFAGKMHAILARKWGIRIKGRDYFDYLWYLGKKVPLNLKHLEARLKQSGHLQEKLTPDKFQDLLHKKFSQLNVLEAKKDVENFLKEKERASLNLWSNDFFQRSIEQIKF